MPTLEQQLADAIAAQNALTQEVANWKGRIDTSIENQRASHEQWKAGVRDGFLLMRRGEVNTAVIDKAWFGVSDAANLDSSDRSMTKWKLMSTGNVYAAEGCVVNVDTVTCYTYYPGHYETPQYGSDKSATFWQFVLANVSATSDQINERIRTIKANIPTYGGWSIDAQMLKTTCVQLPGQHPYSGLFVRMVNRVVSGTGLPQDVSRFGGGSSLKARAIEVYPNITF